MASGAVRCIAVHRLPSPRPNLFRVSPRFDQGRQPRMSEGVYSPGLEGIIAGETQVSTIEGGLQYRGYTIEDLAEHATFEEVAYLLVHGELPKAGELKAFQGRLRAAAHIPTPLVAALRTIPPGAPMMDVVRSGC